MTRFFKYLVSGVAASLLAAGAAAQAQDLPPVPETGTRLKPRMTEVDADKVRKMEREFAECVYDEDPERVDRLLSRTDYLTFDFALLDVADFEQMKEAYDLEDCLGEASRNWRLYTTMHIPAESIRSLLTEASYIDRYRRPIEIPEGAPEFLPNRFVVPGANMERARVMGAFTDCIVYAAPAESDALLRTTPASNREKEAVQALIPAIGGCLVAGNELTLTVPNIRGLVADGLWARSVYGAAGQAEASE